VDSAALDLDFPPPLAAGFDQMGLSETMLEALRRAKYHEPSPVQAGVIPVALSGFDVLGQARTGTGKTASFAIPILERLEKRKGNSPQALILVPTRELAVQVRDEFEKLAHGRKVRCIPVYGGKPIRGQIEKLSKGAEVVVGTPGRVMDHMQRGTLPLDKLTIVVLDEADRMLDIGFRPDIEKILRRCPKERQTLLLSATVAPAVERLAQRYMRDPEVMDFSPQTKTVDTIEQFYFTVDEEKKYELLVRLLHREEPQQAIIFCRTKRGTDRLFHKLQRKFEFVEAIHGDLMQGARDRVMKAFRAGEVKLLIATDVVGRGIDVTGISHIINYDMPQSSDDYVHRVGRTGRMGREGVAYTFVTPEQGNELTRIEMLINRLLVRGEMEGFQTTAAVTPAAPLEVKYYGRTSQPKPAPAAKTVTTPPVDAGGSPDGKPASPGKPPRRKHRRAL
jgi:ATP-dependent RNA helicase DeaD